MAKDSNSIKDLKNLYSQGLISVYEYKEKLRLISEYEQRFRYKAAMKTKDDTEIELVQNIILAVLKDRLNASQDFNRDGYKFLLLGFLPRELFRTGTTKDVIKELQRIRNGLSKLIDDTCQEIRDRNSDKY